VRRLTAILAATLAIAAGCGTEPAQPAADGPTESAVSAQPASPPAPPPSTAVSSAPVPANLQFTAKTLDGAPFDAARLAGKPVVLWFWASWCSTCRAQGPAVRGLAEQYGTEVSFVGVAGLGEPKDMPGFVSRTSTGGFPHLSDNEGAVWRRFKITVQSSLVLLDANGKIVFSGRLSDADLSRRVKILAGA